MALMGIRKRVETAFDRLRKRLSAGKEKAAPTRKRRRLVVDPLEQRQLLSVSPADWQQVLVTERIDADQSMISGRSMAMDKDGDFVVVWTRFDEVYDASGNPVIDPRTGEVMRDANIYARYFTDEVQRLVLPDETVTKDQLPDYARFDLVVNGTEVQKLSITATYEPYLPQLSQELISGTLVFGFDLNRNGIIEEPGETTSVVFDESASLETNAQAIQTQLRGLGGDLADVRVVGISPHEYLIEFGNASIDPNGIPEDQPLIQVLYSNSDLNPNVPGQQAPSVYTQFTTGFYPYAEVKTEREPFVIRDIPVSPDDPNKTALAIEQAFVQTYQTFLMGPTEVMPTTLPEELRTAVPEIEVRPVLGVPGHADGTVFDITFTGSAGKKDHPLLVVSRVVDELGSSVDDQGTPLVDKVDVKTLKEPSPEFRVNPPEPDDPFTYLPDKFDQTNPAVAMDADGEFVITWESEIPEWVDPNNISDIFARRFRPVGLVDSTEYYYVADNDGDGVAETAVPGIVGLVSPEAEVRQTIRLDYGTSNALTDTFRLRIANRVTGDIVFETSDPAAAAQQIAQQLSLLGYEDVAVTVLSAANPYQFQVEFKASYSGPNGAADVLLHYEPAAGLSPAVDVELEPELDLYTFQVNQITVNAQATPDVAMDAYGNFVITWASSAQDISYFNSVHARMFDRYGRPLGDQWQVNTEDTEEHYQPSVGMSDDGHFTIAWTTAGPTILAEVYSPTGAVLQQQFSVATGFQPHITFDSANNMLLTYSGYQADNDQGGTENSHGVYAIEYSLYDAAGNFNFQPIRSTFRASSADFNAGSEPYWPFDQVDGVGMMDADGDMVIAYSGFGPDVMEQDVEALIERSLIAAAQGGATPEEIGQLRAALEAQWNYLRGEGAGVMYSRFDTDPNLGPLHILAADAVANSLRDGRNSRFYIAINPSIQSGNYTLRVYGLGQQNAYEDTQQIQYDRNNLAQSLQNLESALEGLNHTGTAWPNPYGGPVEVRLLSPFEILGRTGTPWELTGIPSNYIVFEVNLQGSVHDKPVFVAVQQWQGQTQGTDELQLLRFINVTGPGYFALQIGGQTTGNIYFDPNFPAQTAAQIENQLQSIVTGTDQNGNPIMPYTGVQVTYRPGTTYEFEVAFLGASGGTDHPPISQAPLQGPPYPDPPMPGIIIGQTLQQGGSTTAPPPRILLEQYGWEGTMQADTSGAMEPDGDFTVVFAQYETYTDGTVSNVNIYYRRFDESTDTAGPTVTDVTDPYGNSLEDGATVTGPLHHIVVTFDEELLTADPASDPNSVLNPENFALMRWDPGVERYVEIPQGIAHVEFGMNKAASLSGSSDPFGNLYETNRLPSNKWEAVITFDANGPAPGVMPLEDGEYRIVVRAPQPQSQQSGLVDRAGNPLGSSGYQPNGASFAQNFVVVTDPIQAELGPEFRINDQQHVLFEQRLAAPFTTGSGEEQSTVSMAMDDDGDFVAVWTAYGLDDPNDPIGGGIYFRMFNRDNEVMPVRDPSSPLYGQPMPDTLVNVTTEGSQRNPAVAMDADGDFVIVWDGPSDNVDGSRGIWLRRFNSVGQPLSGEILVNTITQHDQSNPAVAMDDFGNFVVVWVTEGQQYSYFNEIHAQLFNYRGEPVGSEFRVNVSNLPGTPVEINPVVAMDDDGNFVVVWEQIVTAQNGVPTDTQLVGRLFDSSGNPITGEFRVDTGAGSGGAPGQRTARNAKVVMDDQGRFLVAWESYNGANGYDIFYQWFDAQGNAISNGQANMPEILGHQVNAAVAVDADGDFVVAWNGNGAQPDPLNPANQAFWTDIDNEGVFLRRYDASGQPIDVEVRANRTELGIQQFPSIAMTPEGDILVVWGGFGVGDRHGVFARRFDEPTDTAGPRVTDVLTVDGHRLLDGAQVTGSISQVVVVFSEDMMRTGASAVTNPANYELIKDGQALFGGVVSVDFGLNPETNKWEAVLTLDGNGAAPGITPLETGSYELVIRNTLRDVVGNPLYGTGLNPNGQSFSATFSVVVFGGAEQVVNITQPDDQLIAAALNADPGSPRAVASDGDGEYVAVWTDTSPGHQGIYARLYNDLRWFENAGERRSTGPQPSDEILVTDNPTARFASVARDADGDFVVVWEQDDGFGTGTEDWNIWARRFDATGTAFGEPFLVNTETLNAQRYPAVAMDADGDFVITWQSWEQDGSGWGIYAQRFSPAGYPVGGINEVQVVRFLSSTPGHFVLEWDGDKDPTTPNRTDPIAYDGNAYSIAQVVEDQLNALARDATGRQVGEVRVRARSVNELEIEFVGASGSQDQPLLKQVIDPTIPDLIPVQIYTDREGRSGEFLVNVTTDGNQMYPSIAMSETGEFVITWTSSGQDGDAANETNVYMRKFPSNDVFGPFRGDPELAELNPRALALEQGRTVVSTDDIVNHVVDPGTGYDGVVAITTPGGLGSGALLWTGYHILTAAHVVVDPTTGLPFPSVDVTFDMPAPTGPVTITSTQIVVHPGYDPNNLFVNDIAIVVLPVQAPAAAERYRLYRNFDEAGKQHEFVGYGDIGIGYTGSTAAGYPEKYRGVNKYEVFGEQFNGLRWVDLGYAIPGGPWWPAGTLLAYDFDNGLEANDAFDQLFGISDLGLGNAEAMVAPGDSGGPHFVNGLIAGVTNGILSPAVSDYDTALNSSFGEIGIDARVSYYADWIDSVVALGPAAGPEVLVNTTTAGVQKWSTVAMDADGDFVITWTSYGQDGGGSGYGAGYAGQEGVFAQRFDANAQPVGGEFQVNSYTVGKQQRPQVAMDADGDFIIVWESQQDVGGSSGSTDFGIYAQRYVANSKLGTSPMYGPNGELGGELHVNQITAGDQILPSVAMDHTGDTVIVWTGQSEQPGGGLDVFHITQFQSEDDAPPIVTDVLNVAKDDSGNTILQQVLDDAVLSGEVTEFVVAFSENLGADPLSSYSNIDNPNNWVLYRDGAPVNGAIVAVSFGLNETMQNFGMGSLVDKPTNKYEALLLFDGDPTEPGLQPLPPGVYELRLYDRVEDQFDNQLDGDYDGQPGGTFIKGFFVTGVPGVVEPGEQPPGDPEPPYDDPLVHDYETYLQEQPAVAYNASGQYVVVWVEWQPEIDPATGQPATDPVTGNPLYDADIVGRLFDANGNPLGPQFVVNNYRLGDQVQPAVAMDDFGNFVVVWAGEGQAWDDPDVVEDWGIYARVFDAQGNPLTDQFQVNQYRQNVQDSPSVAMDSDGDFVVAWTSYGQDSDKDGVFARRYRFPGQPLGDEFLVNTTVHNRQENPDVAMTAEGDFVIVWSAYRHAADNSEWGVFGQRYDAQGNRIGGEFLINSYRDDDQHDVHIAMDRDGDFVVVWSSFAEDGNGYGVFAQRFNKDGQPVGSEFRVNQQTLNWQYQPDVAMDDSGRFIVTWTSIAQDNPDQDDAGVFARIFNADGSDLIDPRDPTGTTPLGEFRVNGIRLGDQNNPAVAMDANGNIVVVWVGPDDDQTGVYYRLMSINDGQVGQADRILGVNVSGNTYVAEATGSSVPSKLTLNGTAGDDVFEFKAGNTPAAWVVRVNGTQYDVGSNVTTIVFDGLGGNDKVLLYGTAGNEQLFAWPDHLRFEGGNFTVLAENVEMLTATSVGGSDTAVLYDSAGNDTYYGTDSYGLLYGAGFSLRVYGFASVEAYATAGGVDSARLFGTAADDTLVGNSAAATLTGAGYNHKVTGFRYVTAYGNGGKDVARLSDNPVTNDTLIVTPNYAVSYGSDFAVWTRGFKTVYAQATGGKDNARLYDTSGDDTFVGRPDVSTLTGSDYLVSVTGYRYVSAYGGAGTDTAVLYDRPGATDWFVATGEYARLTDSQTYYNLVRGFENVDAYASDSADGTYLYDSPGNDTFVATPTYAMMSGAGYRNRAFQFGRATGVAKFGGSDQAKLYDSAGDDILYATPTYAIVKGSGFFTRALQFPTVTTFASSGYDIAKLYDSDGDDTFVGRPDYATFQGSGFRHEVRSFTEVVARATAGGHDVAYLYDSPLESAPDHLRADGNWVNLTNEELGYIYWLIDFDTVEANSSNSSDTKDVADAVDFLITKGLW